LAWLEFRRVLFRSGCADSSRRESAGM